MRSFLHLLNLLGAHGPVLLGASLMIGALAPGASVAAEAALPVAAFLMNFGSLVAAGLAPRERPENPLGLGALALAVAVGPGVAAALVAQAAGIEGDLALGMVLAVAGPPIASAAALATILGLPPRFTLSLSLAPMLLCPLVTPASVALLAGTSVDALALAGAMIKLVGGAALAAAVVLSLRPQRATPPAAPVAAAGVSVIGLVIVGFAAAARARVEAEADAATFGALVGGAMGLTVALAALAALLFASLGRQRAGTLGLVWGLRNQSLVWAALGAALPPDAERFLVAMVLPTLIAPLLVRVFGSLWGGNARTRRRLPPREAKPVCAPEVLISRRH